MEEKKIIRELVDLLDSPIATDNNLQKEFCFMERITMTFNVEKVTGKDISDLCKLLSMGGIDYKTEKANHVGDMGFDFSQLAILVPPLVAAGPTLIKIFELWVKSRRVEFTLKNEKTGRVMTYTAENGKFPKEKDMKYLLEIIYDDTEKSE